MGDLKQLSQNNWWRAVKCLERMDDYITANSVPRLKSQSSSFTRFLWPKNKNSFSKLNEDFSPLNSTHSFIDYSIIHRQ